MKMQAKGDELTNAVDFITERFCKVDDALSRVRPEYKTKLHLSELVTIGCSTHSKAEGYARSIAVHTKGGPRLLMDFISIVARGEKGETDRYSTSVSPITAYL